MWSIQKSSRGSKKTKKMIRILQGNLHRSRVANDILSQIVLEKEIDLLLISEQYQHQSRSNWYTDTTNTAAIWIATPGKVNVEEHGAGSGYVWVKSNGVTMVSCYLTPNQSSQEYREMLEKLEDNLESIEGKIIVGGDFNARAVEWGMPATDSRGAQILEMAARQGLVVLNIGSTSTFRRPGYAETIPDISLASENIANTIEGWSVMEEYTGSDHQYVTFNIKSHVQTSSTQEHHKFNIRKMDIGKLSTSIRASLAMVMQEPSSSEGRGKAEEVVDKTMKAIKKACEISMPRLGNRPNRRHIYWWTEQIAELRSICQRSRRVAQRSRNRPEAAEKMMEYKINRKTLRLAIKRSKASKWRELCDDVNNDPWGLAYKIVMKKLKAPVAVNELCPTAMQNIVSTLFPTHPRRSSRSYTDIEAEQTPLFTQQELEEATGTMKKNKAPGPDGIPVEAITVVSTAFPQMMLNMYNTCLQEGVFSNRWKTARLVLINKGKGDPLTAAAYRPLCMLDDAGKLFERLLKSRMNEAVEAAGGLSERQFGFRKGRSTIDAVKMLTSKVEMAEAGNHYSRKMIMFVTLDVKNAFNSARWEDLIEAMKTNFNIPSYLLRVLDDYLNGRSIVYSTRPGVTRREITAGIAQGSILGPDLWNLLYDSLLRTDMPDETFLLGFADDLGAGIIARTLEEAQIKLNQVMRRITHWMNAHGLELAEAKTEIVILTKKRIPTILRMEVGSEIIETKPAAKYLGIMLDNKLNFWQQIKQASDKAAEITKQLSRLMANTGGPTPLKRRLLMNTTNSILLYGAEIWADALQKEYIRKQMAAVQRRGALRVACSYRTVSYAAVNVIASVIPIELLAKEPKYIYERPPERSRKEAATEARRQSIERWQELWEAEVAGRWTARLIPQVDNWVNRKHGEVNFYVTQFLSGHGYFRSYLYKMRKVNSSQCRYCGAAEDTAQHTIFECIGTTEERNRLVRAVGDISADNIVDAMLETEEKWNMVALYIETILRKKKRLKHLDD